MMLRLVCLITCVVVASTVAGPARLDAQSNPAPAAARGAATSAATAPFPPGQPASAADVKALVGNWAIPLETAGGTHTANVRLVVEGATVVAYLSSALVPEQRTTDIIKAGTGIKIRARMNYDGELVEKPTPVALELTLQPAGNLVTAALDFNKASFQISGTGRRVNP